MALLVDRNAAATLHREAENRLKCLQGVTWPCPGQAKAGKGEQVLGKGSPGDGPPKDRDWPGWLIKGSSKKEKNTACLPTNVLGFT